MERLKVGRAYFLAARIFAHLARCAAAIRLRPAADNLRRGFRLAVPVLATPWPVSAPSSANTCCNFPISALISRLMLSILNGLFPVRQLRIERIAWARVQPRD